MVDITYMNGNTEAIVKLNKTIKCHNEQLLNISGNDVKIFGMRQKHKAPDFQPEHRLMPTRGSEHLHKEPEESNAAELVRCHPVKQDLLRMLLPRFPSSPGIKLTGASRSVKYLKIHDHVFSFDSHAVSHAQSEEAKRHMLDTGQQQVQELFPKAGINFLPF